MTAVTAVPATAGTLTPQVDFVVTPAADPFTQQLIQENADLRIQLEQLTAINKKLSRKATTLREGIALISSQLKKGE